MLPSHDGGPYAYTTAIKPWNMLGGRRGARSRRCRAPEHATAARRPHQGRPTGSPPAAAGAHSPPTLVILYSMYKSNVLPARREKWLWRGTGMARPGSTAWLVGAGPPAGGERPRKRARKQSGTARKQRAVTHWPVARGFVCFVCLEGHCVRHSGAAIRRYTCGPRCRIWQLAKPLSNGPSSRPGSQGGEPGGLRALTKRHNLYSCLVRSSKLGRAPPAAMFAARAQSPKHAAHSMAR